MSSLHEGEIIVEESVLRRMLEVQFQQYCDLPLRRIDSAGTDHILYRLGDDKCIRLPPVGWASAQAQKEADWLPRLAPHLPLQVPVPVGTGRPTDSYPWAWSVAPWIEGEDGNSAVPLDLAGAARQLA